MTTSAFALEDAVVKKKKRSKKATSNHLICRPWQGDFEGLSTLSFYGRPQDNLGNIG